MIKPNDLGNNFVVDQCRKINIDDMVRKTKLSFKTNFIYSELEILGQNIHLTSSKTRFNGLRLWFVCPICKRRINNLYKHPLRSFIGCRICLKLKYRNQRYKGMIENSIDKVS